MNLFSHLASAALTDIGKRRRNNEDAFGTFPLSGLFCVADGMGGGDDGEIASAAVIRAVEDVAKRFKPTETGGFAAQDVGDALARNLSKVSAWICRRARDRHLNGCGSTFAGVVFDATDPARALAVHAGDSRVYLLHGRSIAQVTRDHSAAELMGEKDESKVNPMFRSMVVNGIGLRSKVEPEFTPFRVAPGDRVLVCSDGLSRMVPDKRILDVSRDEADPEKAVRALIAAALEAGGIDNVTAVLAEVGPLPPPARRLDAPMDPSSDAETSDGTTTGEGVTGPTGGTLTGETALPDIAEETPFGSEPPAVAAPVAVAPADAPSTGGGRVSHGGGTSDRTDTPATATPTAETARTAGRPRWIPVVVLATAVLIAAVAAVSAARAVLSSPDEATVQHVSVTPVAKVANEVATNEVAANEIVSEPVAGTTNAISAVTVAAETNETPSATAAVAADEAPPEPVPTDFVMACGARSVNAFALALVRLGPKDGPKLDIDGEVTQFRKSARRLVRARVAREAAAAATDLRALLAKAEPVKAELAARDSEEAAKDALAAWAEILSGDPSRASVQRACARALKALPGVGKTEGAAR